MTTHRPRIGFSSASYVTRQVRPFLAKTIYTLFATIILTVYILPLAYMVFTSVQNINMQADPFAPIMLPVEPRTIDYEGKAYDLYNVPIDGRIETLALYKKGRESSQFIDPNDLERGEIAWEGRWRQLDADYRLNPQWDNFVEANQRGRILPSIVNTIPLLFFGLLGTIASSVAVAWGFARFEIPGEKVIFALLIGTLFVPRELVGIPLRQFYGEIGWLDTLLPLIVPQFFASALYVFLLRQYFRTLPRDLDEAAAIDGATPLRTLWSVIVPQSIPIIVTVGLLQFFFIWKDFYQPNLFMPGEAGKMPVALAIGRLSAGLGPDVTEVMAGTLLVLIIPAVVFLFSHRYILQAASQLGIRK